MSAVFAPNNLAVYMCSHVFDSVRPVLLVIHEQGDFQFMCGASDHGSNDIHVVGVGHLTERDPTLNQCADLPEGSEAERSAVGSPWLRARYDEVVS